MHPRQISKWRRHNARYNKRSAALIDRLEPIQMKKVMLTVFKHNHGAYQFFREALQFEIDDTSPSMSGCCVDDCTYEILSRQTKHAEALGHSHGGGGHCGGCCH
uniref:Uncharacterized protein n=3 Tax=Oncorhynchus tshawytscha TaxID=74940 RepID=A0AAZ3NRB5_ONCTS